MSVSDTKRPPKIPKRPFSSGPDMKLLIRSSGICVSCGYQPRLPLPRPAVKPGDGSARLRRRDEGPDKPLILDPRRAFDA